MKCSPVDSLGHGLCGDRASQHVESRDVVSREGEHPLPGPAERGLAGRRVGEHRIRRQRDALRGAGAAAGLDDEGDALADGGGEVGRGRVVADEDRGPAGERPRSASRTPGPGGTTRSSLMSATLARADPGLRARASARTRAARTFRDAARGASAHGYSRLSTARGTATSRGRASRGRRRDPRPPRRFRRRAGSPRPRTPAGRRVRRRRRSSRT